MRRWTGEGVMGRGKNLRQTNPADFSYKPYIAPLPPLSVSPFTSCASRNISRLCSGTTHRTTCVGHAQKGANRMMRGRTCDESSTYMENRQYIRGGALQSMHVASRSTPARPPPGHRASPPAAPLSLPGCAYSVPPTHLPPGHRALPPAGPRASRGAAPPQSAAA